MYSEQLSNLSREPDRAPMAPYMQALAWRRLEQRSQGSPPEHLAFA